MQLRHAQGGEIIRDLLLALKGLQLHGERANPDEQREDSLQEAVGASGKWVAGESAVLWEGAAGLSSPVPVSGQGVQTPGRLVGAVPGSPHPGHRQKVPLQAPSLSTTMQQLVLVVPFSPSPSNLLFSTLVRASALLPPPAHAARAWVQLDGPQDVAGPAT